MTPSGRAPVNEALIAAVNDLQRYPDTNNKLIILITNGTDNCDDCGKLSICEKVTCMPKDIAAEAIQYFGIHTNIINLGIDVDECSRSDLECFSRKTKGKIHHIYDDPYEMTEYLTDSINQYTKIVSGTIREIHE